MKQIFYLAFCLSFPSRETGCLPAIGIHVGPGDGNLRQFHSLRAKPHTFM